MLCPKLRYLTESQCGLKLGYGNYTWSCAQFHYVWYWPKVSKRVVAIYSQHLVYLVVLLVAKDDNVSMKSGPCIVGITIKHAFSHIPNMSHKFETFGPHAPTHTTR